MKNIILSLLMIALIASCQFVKEDTQTATTEESQKPKDGSKMVETFFDNGAIKERARVIKGKRQGQSTTYYMSGKRRAELTYKDNMKHGEAKIFYGDGETLYKLQNYRFGRLDSTQVHYDRKGRVVAELDYRDGNVGTGLKEYYNTGKEITDYPRLIVNTKSQGAGNNIVIVTAKLSESAEDTEFYVGNLADGQYMHDGMQKLDLNNGEAFYLADKSKVSLVPVVAKFKTKEGNWKLLKKTVRIN